LTFILISFVTRGFINAVLLHVPIFEKVKVMLPLCLAHNYGISIQMPVINWRLLSVTETCH